jgi:hypothetical protein
MTFTVDLPDNDVTVIPGESASSEVRVRNTGGVVDAYDLVVGGEAAPWTTIEPAQVRVYPGEEVTAQLRFEPPRSGQVLAGPVPYCLHVSSRENTGEVEVPEGTVSVRQFTESSAELLPRNSYARMRARHVLAIDNRGNTPVEVGIDAKDPDQALDIVPRHRRLLVGPGEAAFVTIKVAPARKRWRGQPQARPFQVLVNSADAPPLALDGTLLQVPILPRGLGKLALATAAGVAGLALIWNGAVQPAVKSSAVKAVHASVSPLQRQIGAIDKASRKAEQNAAEAKTESKRATEEVGKMTSGAKSPTAGDPPTSATSRRLEVTSDKAKAGKKVYVVPKGKQLFVSDVIYENNNGDGGVVQILVDDQVKRQLELANFRSKSDHFIVPLEASAGSVVTLSVSCRAPGELASDGKCHEAVLVSGQLVDVKPAEQAPVTQAGRTPKTGAKG